MSELSYFNGRPIADMTKDELIEVIGWLARENERTTATVCDLRLLLGSAANDQ